MRLIDEIHTPDSSRFWSAETYQERIEAGEEPENFDKEFIRLEYAAQRLPRRRHAAANVRPDLWAAASQRYITIYEMLTGKTFEPGEYPVEDRLERAIRKAGLL